MIALYINISDILIDIIYKLSKNIPFSYSKSSKSNHNQQDACFLRYISILTLLSEPETDIQVFHF